MATCPSGHSSASTDFCDVCGHLMTAPAPVAPDPGVPAEACPACGEPRTGRFCEECSYDFVSGVGGAPTGWVAVISADRDYYQRMLDQGEPDEGPIPFPDRLPDRSLALTGRQIRIGRRSSRSTERPGIDLAGPPEDSGVSHRHAVLLAQPGGGWAVQDLGSTNGTTVNDGTDPISADTPVPLADGDRIHVGAWTTITLREQSRNG
jgi:hypothetical protein